MRMSFNETNFDRRGADVAVVTVEQDVDEFQRFQDDVLKAIEPLENQLVLHESVHPSWIELLRQAGHEAPSQIASPSYPASPSAYSRSKSSFLGVIVGGVIGGLLIGSAITAIGPQRLKGIGLSLRQSLVRTAEAPPKADPADKAPTILSDAASQPAPPEFASRFQPAEKLSVADPPPATAPPPTTPPAVAPPTTPTPTPPQTPAMTTPAPTPTPTVTTTPQTTVLEAAPSAPTDNLPVTPTPAPTPPAEEKVGQSSNVEDAPSPPVSDNVPPAAASASEPSPAEAAAPVIVPMPPSREASDEQINRDKPQVQPSAKRADKRRVSRRRRVLAADASATTSTSPPRPKRGLVQSRRSDQAASLRTPAR
jgi:hypothetical protein